MRHRGVPTALLVLLHARACAPVPCRDAVRVRCPALTPALHHRTRTLVDIKTANAWEGDVAGTRKTTPGFRLVEKHAMLGTAWYQSLMTAPTCPSMTYTTATPIYIPGRAFQYRNGGMVQLITY